MRLDEMAEPTREEEELAELLTVLIGEYEERRYPIPKASPQHTLQHLMEARRLTQKEPSKGVWLEENYFRSFSRQAVDQQSAGEKTRGILSCECRAFYLGRVLQGLKPPRCWGNFCRG
jgi:hypothetical protein